MKIHVEMTEEEMNDFLKYRQEKSIRRADKNRLQELAKKVLWSIGYICDCPSVTVIDKDHAEELLDMAGEYAK